MVKKRLSLLSLSFAFALSIFSPILNVQAKPSVENIQRNYNYKFCGPNLAEADVEEITKMLKSQGKIPKGASKEEVERIVREYLNAVYSYSRHKPSKLQYKRIQNMIAKTKKYGIETDSNYKKPAKSSKMQNVKEEKWNDKVSVKKPLVILMEFQDYTFDYMKNEVTDMKYAKYDKEHYQNMLFKDGAFKGPNGEAFKTVKQWYKEQSGDSLILDGAVVGIYKTKYNAKYYGEDIGGGGNDANIHELVKEAIEAAAADPSVNLADFDNENLYDVDKDKDGRADKTDGIIDHLIVIHASKGQEVAGGTLQSDAIWSQQWVFEKPYTVKDSKGNNISAYNFTIDPQDGAPGVFCHEFGHDLGLLDDYDRNHSQSEPVRNWSVMASGSWAGKIKGTEPVGFSPMAKQFLQANYGGNWLRGKTINVNSIDEKGIDVLLDQASSKGTNLDAVRINLPSILTTVLTPLGKYCYFGGSENKSNNSMTISVDLRNSGNALLKFQTWYEIEKGYDFATVEVREVGTESWRAIKGNITTSVDDPDATIKVEHGITGTSWGKWIDAEFDLAKYVGKNIELRFSYLTDLSNVLKGFYVDNISILSDNKIVFNDSAEDVVKFQLNGFTKDDGVKDFENYYLLEWRNHQGVDVGLKHINGNGEDLYQYNPGLVIWYVDTRYTNESNDDVEVHPGECFNGVIDADQKATYWKAVGTDKNKGTTDACWQLIDSAFSLRRGSEVNINLPPSVGYPATYLKDMDTFMLPIFDDSNDFSNESKPAAGRKIPQFGLKIYVTGESRDRSVAKLHIMRGDSQQEANLINSQTDSETLKFNGVYVQNGTIIVKAEGENLAEKANMLYVKDTPDGKQVKELALTLKDGQYTAPANFAKILKGEIWKVKLIVIEDKNGDVKVVYNSKLNYGIGQDLSSGDILLKNLEVEYLNGNQFELGKEAVVNIRVSNFTANSQKVSLILGLFDENNKLIKPITIDSKVVLENEVKELVCKLQIPDKGKFTIKAFVWDSIENMKPLHEIVKYNVGQ